VGRSLPSSLGVAAVCLLTACSEGAVPTAPPSSPSASPTTTPVAPTLYFNLNDEEALDYLSDIEGRADEALHRGDLGALHDIYTSDGPARDTAARRIIRNFDHGCWTAPGIGR
jgi:hypothetical protein